MSIRMLLTPMLLAVLILSADALAEDPTPGYNNKIPESILTPHDIVTRAGTLKYFDGIPTPETAEALYNHLDYIRGVEAFINGMPAASLEALRRGQASLGLKNSNQVLIFDELMDSNSLFLTGNTDTVYVSSFLDLKKVIIIFFTYFYTAIVLNPEDLSDNMKKYGGFIPGVRPGKRTSEYIDRVLTRVTLPGALFLAFIAILPSIFMYKFHAPFVFGGTGLLIVVGVALDTLQQIESHLIMRHYEGFLKKGRLRSRR